MSPDIRRASEQDAAAITEMIYALAEFEHAVDQCTVTESQIAAALFGDPPTVYGHVAEVDGEIAAMALWFVSFSTWDGVAGIYLEDLFVRPAFRRRGLARALLAALARECLAKDYTRLSWAVLNWNADAIALYDGVGAEPQREWTTYRLSGLRLAELAGPA
jgi:GNAT superfamily N-acetyltransferase